MLGFEISKVPRVALILWRFLVSHQIGIISFFGSASLCFIRLFTVGLELLPSLTYQFRNFRE